MKTITLSAFRLFIVLTLVTGILYPLAVTGIAQACFTRQAGGSLIALGNKVVGSELIAQKFEKPGYFLPRPSAGDFATVPSGASNLGPTSKALKDAVADRAAKFREIHKLGPGQAVPADYLFTSGSGLDPHVSPEAVEAQVERILRERGWMPAKKLQVQALITSAVEPPQWGFLGEPRVNVLLLNLALDRLK